MSYESTPKGRLVVVCGAKGGIGKTMLSINLAVSLVKKGKRVALWDGDFQFGDIDISMNLQPAFSMRDVIESGGDIDTYSFQSLLTEHHTGVHVLPAPDQPEYADLITPEMINQSLAFLKSEYDYVVVDTGTGLNDHNLSLLERADRILLVTTSGLAQIKHTKSMLRVFHALELTSRVQVIINRSTMESMAPVETILNTLQIESAFTIPNHFADVHYSLDHGIPLVSARSKSIVARAIFKMAEQVDANQSPDSLIEKNGFLHKTFTKNGKR